MNICIDKQVSTHLGRCVEQRNEVPHVAVAFIKFLTFIKTAPFCLKVSVNIMNFASDSMQCTELLPVSIINRKLFACTKELRSHPFGK